MNTEKIEQANMPANQLQKNVQANVEESPQYKHVLPAADAEENTHSVDFRRVQHGHGPCACCGPFSE